MAYAVAADVRLICGLTSTQISDVDVLALIVLATAQVNEDLEILIEDEPVIYISTEKPNTINGSNKTFYVKYPYLGDYNNDGAITATDFYAYTINSSGVRTVLTGDSVDSLTGKFVVTNTIADVNLYVSYRNAPVNMTSDTLVKLATSYLTAAFAYTKVNAGNVKSFSVGKISISKDSGFDKMYAAYVNQIQKIKKNWLEVGKSEDVV